MVSAERIDTERVYCLPRFVRSALEAEAHIQPPPEYKYSGSTWERDINILFTFALGRNENNKFLSLKEVGELFPGKTGPLSKEGIRVSVNRTVNYLWHNCPPEIRRVYPLDFLKEHIARPMFLTHPAGTTRDILEELVNGADYLQLRTKHSYRELADPRKLLGRYGITLPDQKIHQETGSTRSARERIATFEEQLKKAGPDTDKEILRQLQDQLTLRFIYGHRDIFDRYFIMLSTLLKNSGFHVDTKKGKLGLIVKKMAEVGIPIRQLVVSFKQGPQQGKHTYYIVLKVQGGEIVQRILSE